MYVTKKRGGFFLFCFFVLFFCFVFKKVLIYLPRFCKIMIFRRDNKYSQILYYVDEITSTHTGHIRMLISIERLSITTYL